MLNSSSKYHILIVDDMPENIQVLSAILYRENINISIAQNGKEAMAIVARRQPDLILLDIMMPEIDGYEVCVCLKQHADTKDIPIIFLTGRAEPEDVIKGFEVGAVDSITKPFHQTELLSRVFTHLELKRARDIITAQNQQLAEQNKTLQELNATKDKFFSIIAHDLRNPFNTLINLSTLLKENLREYTPDELERWINVFYTASNRGYSLLENLLSWSCSQTDSIQFYPTHIPLQEIVTECAEILESQAEDKEITIHTAIPESLVVYVDEPMMKTVLRNLVSNALKFTEAHGTVSISAQEHDEQIEVTVSDTGVGIPGDKIPKLFRIDVHHITPGTAKEKGSGLGLLLCKEFIEKHGGSITVRSEVGKGSHFTFTLPKEGHAS